MSSLEICGLNKGVSGFQNTQLKTQSPRTLELEGPSRGHLIHPPACPSAQTADNLFPCQTSLEKILNFSPTWSLVFTQAYSSRSSSNTFWLVMGRRGVQRGDQSPWFSPSSRGCKIVPSLLVIPQLFCPVLFHQAHRWLQRTFRVLPAPRSSVLMRWKPYQGTAS